MFEYNLSSRCENSTNKENDKFVGIKCADGDFRVYFPVGFHISSDEDEIRKDIRLLLTTIAVTTQKMESNTPYLSHHIENEGAPINSFLFMINDYYERGIYKERESKYEISDDGIIDWDRTVDTQTAYIQNGEVYYLDYVSRKTALKENEIISQIYQYCLYLSFKAMGWIYSNYMPPKPHIIVREKYFISTLKNKLLKTFNDKNRLLFWHMIAILEDKYDRNALNNFTYGTYRFEYVWEKLIDNVYGIGEEKKEYFPQTFWQLYNSNTAEKNSKLEPDTIMLFQGNVFVLDAKYYACAIERNKVENLPESTSINKQITYGEYVATEDKFKKKHGDFVVYNAFLMPFDKEKWGESKIYKWIGCAWGDWKGKEAATYSQIHGVLIDTKSLMIIGTQRSDSAVNALAKLLTEHTIHQP